jgi:hypothetical protein
MTARGRCEIVCAPVYPTSTEREDPPLALIMPGGKRSRLHSVSESGSGPASGAGSLGAHVGRTLQVEGSLSGLAVRTGETLDLVARPRAIERPELAS